MPFSFGARKLRNNSRKMKMFGVNLHTLLLFLIILTGIATASRSKRQMVFGNDNGFSRPDCRTPDGREGRCTRVSTCPSRFRPDEDRLGQYICGWERNQPRICCAWSGRGVATRRPVPVVPEPVPVAPEPVPVAPEPVPVAPEPVPVEEPRNNIRVTQSPGPSDLVNPPFLPRECGVFVRSTLNRVVGGREADRGSWPWMAVIFVRRSNGAVVADCGGTLVTSQHVVTAAHCVVSGRRSVTLDPSRVVLRLGAHNISVPNEPGSVEVGVEAIRRHEQYNSNTYRNDIAVLKLSRPVTFTRTVSPSCLPYNTPTSVEDLVGSNVIVIGHGNTANDGNSSAVLMQAGFKVQSQDICRRAYEPLEFSNIYLCAGTLDGSKDACQGDSGGPLVWFSNYRYYLVGITSFGAQCGTPNSPGVYTRVSEYLDWLATNLSN